MKLHEHFAVWYKPDGYWRMWTLGVNETLADARVEREAAKAFFVRMRTPVPKFEIRRYVQGEEKVE